MLRQKQRKSTFTIKALVIGTLAFGAWLHPWDAYGMGHGERIDGLLDRTVWGLSIGGCVNEGTGLTGEGVEAISYNAGHFRCDMFHQVDDLVANQSWCSQWVVPGTANECLPPPGPTSASTLFLGCHQPGCALWRFSFSASDAQKYRIQSSVFSFGPWTTWTVTSSNTYFPHLAQNPLYFRIRGENSAGNGSWKTFYVPGKCGGDSGPID